jgi:hypothetical protein
MNPISPVISHIDVVHALLMDRETLGLHLLHFRLTALDFSHDNQRVLKLIDLLLEVHPAPSIPLQGKGFIVCGNSRS